jgi:NADH-quinone oxidoreductase subunit L
MFLALGVGAYSAAIFHFMIHAFFKALLFLGAGAVITALHHEHDMFKMGGLKNKLPVVYWTFLIGAASLAALPFVTGGFYSKDQILWLTWSGERSNIWFFLAALTGAFITALYTFRMVFITFYGEPKTSISHAPGKAITTPLIILAVLSTFGGFIELPHTLGHVTILSDFVNQTLPVVSVAHGGLTAEWLIQGAAALLSLTGVFLMYRWYVKDPGISDRFKNSFRLVHQFWYSGWGFDKVYDALFVKPFIWTATVNKNDLIDKLYEALVSVTLYFNGMFSKTQNGVLRWYIMGIVAGAVLVITLGLLI